MQVVATAAQPTLQFEVTTTDQTPRRMTVFTGTVDVVPPDSRLVAAEDRPGIGWPYVEGLLFGGDLTMTIAYRLTVITSA